VRRRCSADKWRLRFEVKRFLLEYFVFSGGVLVKMLCIVYFPILFVLDEVLSDLYLIRRPFLCPTKFG